MIEKIRKMKNEKGFTLVELIVVLVILAILAALLIPALTGYIDKANKEKVISETRMVVMAAQTTVSELYGKSDDGKLEDTELTDADDETMVAIKALSEVSGKINEIDYNAAGVITKVDYTSNGWNCIYTNDNGYGDPTPASAADEG